MLTLDELIKWNVAGLCKCKSIEIWVENHLCITKRFSS